jgi:hypothetical protein
MKKVFSFLLLAVAFLAGTSFLEKPASPVKGFYDLNDRSADTFPVPPKTDKLLFYVQRTFNINTIVYELNVDKNNNLNELEPVHIYWIRYAADAAKEELSYIQRKYAYGLNAICIDKEKQTYKLNFVSYKKRDIYLIKSTVNKQYHACMTINGKLSYVDKIFAKIEGGSYWVPHVAYIEVQGKDIGTGHHVSEKIIP